MALLIHDYLKTGQSIPGWFEPHDIRLFIQLNGLQAESDLSGDLFEIGVFHGKSAILLGYFLKKQERFLVCDPFDVKASSAMDPIYHRALKREDFERNYLRFHASLPIILDCLSTNLGDKELSKTFRFIHIDGSHQYDVVRQDIATAKALLLEGGIVCFDDYRGFEFPGVAAAVWQEITAGGVLRPLCASPLKLYVTNGPDRFDFLPRLKRWAASQSDLVLTPGIIGDYEFVCIRPESVHVSPVKEIYWHLVQRWKGHIPAFSPYKYLR